MRHPRRGAYCFEMGQISERNRFVTCALSSIIFRLIRMLNLKIVSSLSLDRYLEKWSGTTSKSINILGLANRRGLRNFQSFLHVTFSIGVLNTAPREYTLTTRYTPLNSKVKFSKAMTSCLPHSLDNGPPHGWWRKKTRHDPSITAYVPHHRNWLATFYSNL